MRALVNEEFLLFQANLAVESEPIDVTPAEIVTPDYEWSHVDSRGHFHAFSTDEANYLPTIRREAIEMTTLGDPDIPPMVQHRCLACDSIVEPRWNIGAPIGRIMMPGRLSWRVEARGIGPVAAKLAELHDTHVGIRIEVDDETHFGIGVIKTTGRETGYDNSPRWFGCVYGVGPLGHRRSI